MAAKQITPNPPATRPGSGFFRSLLHGRIGQLFLVLVALRLLRPTGIVPPAVNQVVDLGLVVSATWLVMRSLVLLRYKLLWRIRRKLIISYLLIGLVPTVLILFFFVLSGLLVFGQVSSYILSSRLGETQSTAARLADVTAAEILGTSDLSGVEAILRSRLAPLTTRYPDAAAIYVSPDSRVVVGEPLPLPATFAQTVPPWAADGYRGLLRLGERYFLVGFSEPPQEGTAFRVLVTIPIESALTRIEEETGLHASGVSTAGAQEPLSLDDVSPSADSPFAMRWASIIEARPWVDPPATTTTTTGLEEIPASIILIRFSPWDVYQVLSTNTPQLGQAILVLLGVLASLFLAIEVVAALVGLLLARSITGSIHALSRGTDHVRQGDFAYRVQVRTRDQLGELAESFNLMTASIQDLLKQSAEKERLEEELRIARNIQMSLLPKDAVQIPGVSVAAVCLPAAEVGGDYYDLIPLGEDRLAVLIADVSGKGTSAALYMAELKGLVLSLSRMHDSPRSLLIEANRILGANLDARSFITMSYAVVDMDQRTMTYARAGHSPLLQVSTAGGARALAPDGMGLGLDRGDHRFESILRQESLSLQSGDLFLFFTDGLSEAMNSRSDLFGEPRLRRLLEQHRSLPLEDLIERIVDEIVAFAEGVGQHDDMTMVLLRVT